MSNRNQLVLFSVAMALIVILAYAGLIPTKLHDIPYYDSIGHFGLYGLWGYFFGKAYPKSVTGMKYHVTQGTIIVAIIAIVEESLQQLSPMRSFSPYDLGFGLLGIATSAVVLNHHFRKRKE